MRLFSVQHYRSHIEISAAALKHNLAVIKSQIAAPCQFMAVVKGNAWGAGTMRCARIFVESGADWLGVTTIDDAIVLRRAFDLPILLLSAIPIEQIEEVIGKNIEVTIASPNDAQQVAAVARRHSHPLNVQIKINTGLNRLGVLPREAAPVLAELMASDQISVTAIFSHFSSAEDPAQDDVTQRQLSLFNQVVRDVRNETGWDGMMHIANTAATLSLPHGHLDMVRISIGLMGLNADHPFGRNVGIAQVYSWKTSVVHRLDMREGEHVGYGRQYVCPTDTTIVTIPVGWGDGLPRDYSRGGHVLINGMRCPMVAVSMELSTVDLGQRMPDLPLGQEVVIFGIQNDQTNEPMTQCAGIGLEGDVIMTLLSDRIPRILVG